MARAQQNQVRHISVRITPPQDLIVGEEALHERANALKRYLNKGIKTSNWIFQWEEGEETHKKHIQGFVQLHDKKRPSQMATLLRTVFPEDGTSIHVSPTSKHGQEALEEYAMKEETRILGPWSKRPIYLGQDLPSGADGAGLLAWQKAVWSVLSRSPDDRTLYWVWCKRGASGKTKFAKWLSYYHGALRLAYAPTRDMVNLVYKAGPRKIYVFDLSRARPTSLGEGELYSALEDIKNGHIMNSKYETAEMMFEPPHVLVFANMPPDVSQCSMDRWVVTQLQDVPELEEQRRPPAPLMLPGGIPTSLDEAKTFHAERRKK